MRDAGYRMRKDGNTDDADIADDTDIGYRILDTGYWMLDTGCWILDAG